MAYLPCWFRNTLWAALLFLLALPALAADITAVRSWRAPDNTRLVFDLSGPVKFQLSPESTPARLVVDIEGARPAGPLALPAAQAPLKSFRLEPTANGQRLVIETSVELMPKVFQLAPNEKYGHRLVLDLYEKSAPRPVLVDKPAGAVAIAVATGAAATALPEKGAAATARPTPAVTGKPLPEAAGTPGEKKPGAEKSVAATGASAIAGATAATTGVGGATLKGGAQSATAAAGAPTTGATAVGPGAGDEPAKPGKPAPGRPGERDIAGARALPADVPPEPQAPEKFDPRRYRNIIVAIDAGHGGEDPGAIGQDGTHEKNVTLAIARELQSRLEAEPGITAVLTRSGDYFIPLQDRRRIARYQHKADIFVSIHADSAPSSAARGASVFALSLKGAGTATSRFARMLAERENRADLIGGAAIENEDNVLRNVLADMVVAGSLDHSLHMGRNILAGLDRIGRLHSHAVEQAGFAVLKEPGMVSLLVETGFISNPDEEKKLISRQYQQDIAAAVAAGVRRYCVQYPAPATYFAWLAERGRAVASDKPGRRPRDVASLAAVTAANATSAANASGISVANATTGGDAAHAVPGSEDKGASPQLVAARPPSPDATGRRTGQAAARDNGSDSDRLRKGGKEEVPRFRTHRVGPGESLTRLSDRYGVSMSKLRETNRLRDDNIRIGQTLKIPQD